MTRKRNEQEMQLIADLTEKKFFEDFAEIFAHYNIKELMQSISSFMQLNYGAEELREAGQSTVTYRKLLALITLTLINRDAVVPLTDFNEAAENDLAKLRRETGIDTELIPAPLPPPPTEAELLAEEVRQDWKTLSMDKIRQKKANSRKYSETLERLANNNTLESSVTSLRQAQ